MSVRTPWLSWRSPEITEVSWFDFELNWRSLSGGSGWFLVRFLVLLQDYWGVAVVWFWGVNGLIKHRWEDQYRFSRFIHWLLRVTVGLTLALMVLMSQRLINSYPFWDLDINFMLKMLFILDNLARCWTNQWVNRKHNSFLTYCLSYACHFRTQSKYDANYSESEELTDHLNNCCCFVSNVLKNHASFRFSEGSLMVV